MLLLVIFTFPAGWFGGIAHAADTVITFDEVPADTLLETQYHDKGVGFGLPPYASLPATSQIPPGVTCCQPITRAAPAGHTSQVADISLRRTEFWISGMFGTFSTYRQRVQVTVGNAVAADTSSVTLSAFDINGALAGQPATSAVSGSGTPVTLTVTAPGSTPTIAYFLVQSGDYNKGLWIDDLTYDNPTMPAPPDFAFAVQGIVWPGSALVVTQGDSLTMSLPLRRFNGSNGGIALSGVGLPVGIAAKFAPNPLPGTSTLTNLILSAAPDAPLVTDAPFSVLGVPAGSAVGPAPRSAQLLMTVLPPVIITTSGAGGLPYDRSPCIPLELNPIYVSKDPKVIQSDVTLALRVFVDPSHTADLPAGLHASFDPPVSARAIPTTLHRLIISYDAGTLGSKPITLVVQGTSGPLTVLSQPFGLRPIPGVIDNVNPPGGRIPNRVTGQPGTKVTITGQGFCPGARVRFGNFFAEVDPEELTPTKIVASIPILATDGPPSSSSITIIGPGGGQIGSLPPTSERFAVDSIRNTAGFSFHNYVPHTTFDQLTAAYGAEQTEDQIPLCWPFDCTVTIHDLNAIIWLDFLKSFTDVPGDGGACYGIALAAQKFIEGQPLRSDFPPFTALNNFGLDAPSGPSPALKEYINSQVTIQLSVQYITNYLSQSHLNSVLPTSDVLHLIHDNIRNFLAAGEMSLIALRYGNFQGHLVTAYDIQDTSNDPIEYLINVYNPNVEFTQDENLESGGTHALNVTKSQIKVTADGTWTLLANPDNPVSGNVSGLIVTPLSAIPTNPILPGSAAALLSSPGQLTIFGTLNAGPQNSTPASRTTQLADNAGHTLFDTNGRLNNHSATRLVATPFAPFATKAGRGEAFLVAPKSGPLVQSVVGTRLGTDTHLVTSGGLTARVATEAKPSVVDQIGFNPAGTISFLTKASHKPLILGLMTHSDVGVQSAQIETTSSHGASDELLFDDKRTSVILRHGGPAAPLRLRLSTLAPKGGPVEFDSGPLQVAEGVTATFVPASWTGLATVTMTIRDLNGSEYQAVLQNRLTVKPLGHILRLDIDRVPYQKRSRALDVYSRFKKIPPDSQVVIIWIVREKRHIIAHETRTLSAKDLRPGKRRDRYIFSAPAEGEYEVEADLMVCNDEGVIPTTHTSKKSAAFRIGSVRY